MQDISDYFRSLVERELPEQARVLASFDAGDVVVLATWRLHNDASRPNKRSRVVRIVIPARSVEKYVRGADEHRLASDRRFAEWINRRLAGFDPNHEAPPGAEPPSVSWILDSTALNG